MSSNSNIYIIFIRRNISTKKQNEDSTLYYKALKQLRADYGIKFNDSSYQSYYDNFNKQYGA